MMLIKKRTLFLLGAQLVLVAGIRAEQGHLVDERECCEKSIEFKGSLLRGYGPNLAGTSGALAACPLFDKEGHMVGFTATFPSGPDAVRHTWTLKHGTLEIVVKNGVSDFRPVDATVVSSFQQLAPFEGNPNAGLLTFESDHFKDGDASVEQWNATGSLKKANRVEFRCVYLTLFGSISQCLGCHWFIGKE